MPYPTTGKEITAFFGHIETIQAIQDITERNKAIDSVFGALLANDPTKLHSLYTLFSEILEDTQYHQLLIYCTFRVFLEQNGLATEQTTKLYTIFNKDIKKIKKYLCDYAKQNLDSPEPMHDACNFAIPSQDSQYTTKVWAELSAKYLIEPPFRQLLAQAPEIEALIKTQAQAIPYLNRPSKQAISALTKEIEALNNSIKKRRAKASKLTQAEEIQLQDDVNTLMQKKAQLTTMGIPFNNELSLTALNAFREKYVLEASSSYKQFLENGLTKKDHEHFSNLARQDDDTLIPPLRIDGATIGHPGYYLMKVPVMDEAHAARAAYFGKLTSCCQSLSGEAGEPCVIHGLTSPNGGFYVICHGDVQNPQITDEVLGQSWVWRGKKNEFVFDSIEITEKNTEIYENTQQIVTTLVRQAAQLLVSTPHIERVLCGASSGISKKVGITETWQTAQFRGYNNYSDSSSQLILRDKHRPFYLFEANPEDTQKTKQWIIEKLKNPVPLTDSNSLWEAINWAILTKNKNLIQAIQSLANQKTIDRVPELNHVLHTLQEYIKVGLTANVRTSIANNSLPLEAHNAEKKTPLMLATHSKDINLILTLIKNGADLESIGNQGRTALLLAAQFGNIQTIITLIKAHANLEHIDNHGQTALMLALQFNNTENALLLIKKRINLKYADNTGQTALIWAVRFSNTNAVIALIKENVNLEHIDNNKKTALIYALGLQKIDIALALIKAGANLEQVNHNKQTLLTHAILLEQTKIAFALIEAGANLDYLDPRGKTALMYAIEKNNEEIISAIQKKLATKKTAPPPILTEQVLKNDLETKAEQPEKPDPSPDIVIRYR